MNGNKWADYIITEVHKDSEKRIVSVKIGLDIASSSTIYTTIKTKDDVINMLKSGQKIVTSRFLGGKYMNGASVTYYKETNGIEYLKSTPNGYTCDNLDSLPEF